MVPTMVIDTECVVEYPNINMRILHRGLGFDSRDTTSVRTSAAKYARSQNETYGVFLISIYRMQYICSIQYLHIIKRTINVVLYQISNEDILCSLFV